ncbi:hypothetical protein GA0116948_10661 [Chitinophaga costaii]|uniref:Outer membrane protein beta-barrel domain-containing protein n=1 Tax=Chitinophaga costaii TaxID=1335309 RepID=A0A1C4DR86_9BACT|nr:hypothetical protein [Chitinophaga costaii]PUZ27750.1 hypothetical protein DCM91_05940 [Chitinophaga costaii]SCC33859.1 hypothetical protein GA0116948_10661 [Chitinophaga costaii]
MKHIHPLYYFFFLLFPLAGKAQDDTTRYRRDSVHFHWKEMAAQHYPSDHKGVYPSWGGDGPLLSFGSIKYDGDHVRNIPRFTFFFNVGTNFNYDINKNFGVFTGLNLRNIGLITKDNDSLKLKRRLYTLGIPIGLKVGDVRHGSIFFFAGGEYDLALNYKEKQFIDGDKRHKFSQWFSDRTPLLLPSVFAGIRVHPGIGLKVQYFLTDFFNKDFHETVDGLKTYPYAQTQSKMFFVTLSYDFGKVDYGDEFKDEHARHHHHRRSFQGANY